MDDPRTDFVWDAVLDSPRHVSVHDELRYARDINQVDPVVDGLCNYHWLMSPGPLGRPNVRLEGGINATADLVGVDGLRRRGVIAIRSSPWKAGSRATPWHDEFDLDHGHIRYFGDHKPTTLGLPGATLSLIHI